MIRDRDTASDDDMLVDDPEAAPLQDPADLEAERLASQPDGLPVPRRYWAAAAIWLALSMNVIDSSIANVALPTIARDVGATPAASIWVVNAYQVAMAMVLLPIAALGEIFTYRRIYMIGLALFVSASFACATATSLTSLALARFLQGLGAAGVLGVNGALVRFTYPKKLLGRGIGVNAMIIAVVQAAGPSVASAILAIATWQWLFAVNVPLGLLALIVGWRCLPRTVPSKTKLDLLASVYSAIAFLCLFLTGSDLAHGHASPRTAIEAAAAILFGILLVRRSRGQERPLLPLDLVRDPILKLSYLTSAAGFGGQVMLMISMPFYLHAAFGFGQVEIGLLITPLPVGIAIAAPISGWLVERFPAGLLCGIGQLILAGGMLVLAATPVSHAVPILIGGMFVSGLGFGLFQTPNNRAMLAHAPPDRSGAAAGMQAVVRLLGMTTGAILVAFIFRLVGPAHSLPLIVASGGAVLSAYFSVLRLRI